MDLSERKLGILKAIIDDYIMTGFPVGSRTISKKHGFELSSATIRNEMADLEELGFLDQPYTSAGRIPSSRGSMSGCSPPRVSTARVRHISTIQDTRKEK